MSWSPHSTDANPIAPSNLCDLAMRLTWLTAAAPVAKGRFLYRKRCECHRELPWRLRGGALKRERPWWRRGDGVLSGLLLRCQQQDARNVLGFIYRAEVMGR